MPTGCGCGGGGVGVAVASAPPTAQAPQAPARVVPRRQVAAGRAAITGAQGPRAIMRYADTEDREPGAVVVEVEATLVATATNDVLLVGRLNYGTSEQVFARDVLLGAARVGDEPVTKRTRIVINAAIADMTVQLVDLLGRGALPGPGVGDPAPDTATATVAASMAPSNIHVPRDEGVWLRGRPGGRASPHEDTLIGVPARLQSLQGFCAATGDTLQRYLWLFDWSPAQGGAMPTTGPALVFPIGNDSDAFALEVQPWQEILFGRGIAWRVSTDPAVFTADTNATAAVRVDAQVVGI